MNRIFRFALAVSFLTTSLPPVVAKQQSFPFALSGKEAIDFCFVSPDGRYQIGIKRAYPPKTVSVLDWKTGKSYDLEYVGRSGIFFDPTSRYAVLSCYQGHQSGKDLSARNITLLDLRTGEHQYIPSPSEARASFSPDGEHVIFMLENTAQFMIYQLASKKVLHNIRLAIGEHGNKICWIDKNRFALTMKDRLRIYNVADLSNKDFPTSDQLYATQPRLSSDGKYLVYSLIGQTRGMEEFIHLHNVERDENKQISNKGSLIYAFSQDSKKLHFISGKSSYSYEIATGKMQEKQWPQEVMDAVFSRDAKHVLISTHAGLFHHSLETGKSHQLNNYGGLSTNSVLSPFGDYVAFSDYNDNCFCYHFETKKLQKLKMRGRAANFSFLPDKKHILGSAFEKSFIERIDSTE